MSDFALPEYTVYVDTNAAYSPKPNEPISEGFLDALSQVRQLTKVVVKVPSVVVRELCYQQTNAALQAGENQRKNAETIKQICGIAQTAPPDFQSLKKGCKERLDACLRKSSIAVIDVPLGKIDWQRIIESACWRIPPFEKPKSEGDLAEKGFRDSLIIESIVHDATGIKAGHIAILSKDKMFACGLENRIGGISRPHKVYEQCSELLSELRLLSKNKSDQFVSAVLEKVGAVFYNPDDPNCVVFAHKLLEKLRDEYDEALSKPTILSVVKPGEAVTLPRDWLSEITEWSPVSDLKVIAAAPEFMTINEQGQYQWKSGLTLTRLLRRKYPASRQQFAVPDERIRIQRVDVLWRAEINPNTAEFSNTQIDQLQPIFGEDFLEPTWQLRSRFGFPMIPGMDP